MDSTYFADLGDDIFVTRAGGVITEDDFGITSGDGAANVDVAVSGDISAGLSGVLLQGAPASDTPSEASVVVTKAGYVTSQLGVLMVNQVYASVRVAGEVFGTDTAVQVGADVADIRVSGRLDWDRFGLYCRGNSDPASSWSGDFNLLNTGIIEGAVVAVAADAIDSVNLKNLSVIRGGEAGVELVVFEASRVENIGTITSNTGTALATTMLGDAFFELRNAGTLQCLDGLAAKTDGSASIRNSGRVAGDQGIWGTLNAEFFELHNYGEITAVKDAVHSSGFEVRIVNTGTITGDVRATGYGTAVLVNAGLIDGDVSLTAFGTDRIFRNQGEGRVTGAVSVEGGKFEEDTIDNGVEVIGGTFSDRFVGGGLNDRMVGKGGDDDLRGSSGRDRLNGGDGVDVLAGERHDDRLTGGAGADVFVFAADAGTDRITDFEQGLDVMRIADYQGGFDTLSIDTYGAQLRIMHDGGVILLIGQAGLTLGAGDFEFV